MPETVIPRKKDGLVYAKVIKISEDKDLIVEHSLGKRMVFIEEGQPFYGEKDESVQTRVGMTPIRAGDTIAYRPDKTFAGNHVFVGLPEEKE